MKAPGRRYISILLLILFFAGLVGMFFPKFIHEILGCAFIATLIFHNLEHAGFYRSIKNRLYHGKTFSSILCIVLLIFCIPILVISGMALADWLPSKISSAICTNWRSVHLSASIAALLIVFFHCMTQAKRYFRRKLFYGLGVFFFLIAAGGIFGLPYLDRWYHQVYVDSDSIIAGERIDFEGRVLTVYFSRVGNTDFPPDVDAVSGASVMKDGERLIGNGQMIALMVQNATGSDLFPLQTEKTYPADYGKTTEEANRELKTGEYPALKSPMPNLDQYDTIILVYPLWWGTIPMVVEGFLCGNDLSGKTLIPIVTHGGGGEGKSLERIRQITQAKVMPPLSVYSSDIPAARRDIAQYLKKTIWK